MKIYTRTGDGGQSSLYNGERASKTHPVFEALGSVDELNSVIGLAREYATLQEQDDPLLQQLVFVQSRLLDVGSAVATPKGTSSEEAIKRVAFDPEATTKLEAWIDEMNETLPPLKQFILPSGGLAASQLHVARSICRRAERSIVPMVTEGDVDAGIVVFMNRLSDYLFTAARFMATKCGRAEQKYKKSGGVSTHDFMTSQHIELPSEDKSVVDGLLCFEPSAA